VQKWRRGNGWARLIDNAMIKAIARAFRWQEQLDTHATNAEIAAAEDQRVLHGARNTADPPGARYRSIDLDARQLAALTLAVFMKPFPVEWERQWRTFTTAKPNALGRSGRTRHMA
jgi:hypothetical protein